ncbi:MAG: RsmG family class I SAM-dependent methyltransferase, partial [Anaerolineae bacterium]|nr:RsmG family class I SAM-dependent methyltransferase [Anaerolineae bacterium]
MNIADLLRAGATAFKLDLTADQLEAFEQYAQALIAWNRHSNLTRITDPADIAVKHFLDSLSIYPLLPA